MNASEPLAQIAVSGSCHPVYDDLLDRISSVLFAADPMDINYKSNTDEYDMEAKSILSVLKETASVGDVQTVIHETFCRWFDAEAAGQRERYLSVASEIWSLWCSYNEQLP